MQCLTLISSTFNAKKRLVLLATSRSNCGLITTTVITTLLSLLIQTTHAAPPVYSQRDANGAVIFSDAPLINGQMVRSSYQTDYGRPAAFTSCIGLGPKEMAQRAKSHERSIMSAAKAHNLDANLIRAVAQVESCFDQRAVSRVGAQGVMQLMPATATELGVTDSFNPAQNIHGGASYLAKMLNRFDQNLRFALAAYNAGPGAVEKHLGIPPFPETQQYVKKVLNIYKP